VAVGHPRRTRPNRAAEAGPPRRSNAAIPVALVVVGLGLYFGRYTVLLPVTLGVALLYAGGSFLSTRVNPLSTHFYHPTKPSWTAILVVFLAAVVLLAAAYELFLHQIGPVLPHL
jgi:hypothetical protein